MVVYNVMRFDILYKNHPMSPCCVSDAYDLLSVSPKRHFFSLNFSHGFVLIRDVK